MSACAFSLTEAAEHIREGRLTSVELVRDCLARIDEVEPAVQAWAFLDRDHALRQARGPRRAARATATRPVRCTACRSASRTSSIPRTIRPNSARRSGPAARRGTMRRRSRGCAPPARSSWARPLPPNMPISIPARRAIRMTRSGRPAVRRAVRRRRWRRIWCRLRSAPRPMVRSSGRPHSAAWSASSRRTG